jgi:ATP-dependent Clp protease ATP-binding subunit ClpA
MFERYSDRARRLIVMALWSARNRGGPYIEPEDLLHALIREDRGEFVALAAEISPGAPVPIHDPAGGHRPFFADEVARKLLRELHEDTDSLKAEMRTGKLEPVPHVDMPLSHSLKRVLGFVAKAHQNDATTIEPLHLLAAMVEDRDSRLAQLLRDQGITRQTVAKALDSGA